MGANQGRLAATLAAFVASVLPALGLVQAATPPRHAEEIAAFAALMADIRTAAERCPGVQIDQNRVDAEKDRLHIGDVDYFVFRKMAHDRAEELGGRLVTPTSVQEWCGQALELYGERGSTEPGVLRR